MIPDRFCRRQEGADRLQEGYWLIQRRRALRVDMPVRIWFGQPDDPVTGEPIDRSPRWRIQIGGVDLDEDPLTIGGITFTALSDFWPACMREPIDEPDYRFRIERQEWAAEYDPFDPFGETGGRIDSMTATLPFLD